LRSACASALSSFVVFRSPSPYLHHSVWIPVLALACCKPTLGHTLQGWWDAFAGGLVGLALALLSLALLGPTPEVLTLERQLTALLALGVMGLVVTFTFGDHIQAYRSD
jgi:uncharacterized membrane protein YccC